MDQAPESSSFGSQDSDRRLANSFRQSRSKVFFLKLLYGTYKLGIAPFMRAVSGPGFACKFYPTCADYAREAFETLPAHKAFVLSTLRVLRCNPWSQRAIFDPVQTPPALITKVQKT